MKHTYKKHQFILQRHEETQHMQNQKGFMDGDCCMRCKLTDVEEEWMEMIS